MRRVPQLALAVTLAFEASAIAQVKPQVSPFLTKGCEKFDELTPKQYQGGDNPTMNDEAVTALVGCMEALNSAIQQFAEALKSKTELPQTTSNQTGTTTPPATPPSDSRPPAQGNGNGAAQTATAAAQGKAAANDALAKSQPTADTAEEQVHIELVKTYLSFRNLQRWKELVDSAGNPENRVKVVSAFNSLAERLHSTLTQHGLTQPFAASLVTAFSLSGSGASPGASPTPPAGGAGPAAGATPEVNTTDTSSTFEPAGFVNWESIHFYAAPDRHWDVNVSGTFGFQPVLALVQPAAGQTPTRVSTTYQQAFVWSVAGQYNIRFADLAEFTPFGRMGQSVLSSKTTLNDHVTPAIVQVSASNDTGRAEMFFESGVRLSIYGQSLEILHLKRGLLTPMFSFGAGIRKDNRFTAGGVLKDLKSPEQRMFYRFQVDGLQLANKDQADRPFTVGVSVDFDGALFRRQGSVPSGTRILIRGDLNLFKAAQTQK